MTLTSSNSITTGTTPDTIITPAIVTSTITNTTPATTFAVTNIAAAPTYVHVRTVTDTPRI